MKVNKEGKIELYRFLASVFIMIGHYVLYMHSDLSIPFTVSFQFVEFFFIITGFFTARHFDEKWKSDNNTLDILKYHLKKFIRFLPYTIPAVISIYALESYGYLKISDIAGFLDNLKDIILEITFLSVFRSTEAHLFIMWYLSAMFITLPILIGFFLIKKKIPKIILCFILPTLFYVFSPDYTAQEPVNQLLRSFLGMMLGGGIYYLSQELRDKNVIRVLKWVGTVFFAITYLIPLVLSYLNTYYKMIYVICFAIWVLLMMSDLTVLKPLNSVILGYLGKISMPIFIWHIAVFKIIGATGFLDDNKWLQFVVSIFVVFLISVLNMKIVKACKMYSKKT